MVIKEREYVEFMQKHFRGEYVENVPKRTIDKLIGKYWANQSTYTIRNRRIALEQLGFIEASKVAKEDRLGRKYVLEYRVNPNNI